MGVSGNPAVTGCKLKNRANFALKMVRAQLCKTTTTNLTILKVCIHGFSRVSREDSADQKVEKHITLVNMAKYILVSPMICNARCLFMQNNVQVEGFLHS
jgi:hypothetical protein